MSKKNRVKIESSAVYMVSPQSLVDNNCPLLLRTRDRAYANLEELTTEQRTAKWDALRDKIAREGFDPEQPIIVQLLRKEGKQDKLRDGHHRLAIALDLELPLVPVRFIYKYDQS